MATDELGRFPVKAVSQEVSIPIDEGILFGRLEVPERAIGLVVFAHGSGSSRFSPRNRFVAELLKEAGLATLLVDLLTVREERVDESTGHYRFDIPMLGRRLIAVTDWVGASEVASLPLGYFGASTGAAAALLAAAQRPEIVRAVVSRGGRPDLAADAFDRVRAATLLIVGGDDEPVLGMNRQALQALRSPVKELRVVPGATHLFEEPGALEIVARHSAEWFRRHLPSQSGAQRTREKKLELDANDIQPWDG